MAVLANIHDKAIVKVADFEDGVGVVLDHTKWCALRQNAETWFADFNAQCAVADWSKPAVRTALIRDGKQLALDFCAFYGVDYKELL